MLKALASSSSTNKELINFSAHKFQSLVFNSDNMNFNLFLLGTNLTKFTKLLRRVHVTSHPRLNYACRFATNIELGKLIAITQLRELIKNEINRQRLRLAVLLCMLLKLFSVLFHFQRILHF